MELLPEWAPNVHPMLVHFPLALLLAAMVADAVALAVRRWSWLRPATIGLYVGGAVSAVVTYVTGTWAADTVSVAAEAQSVLSEHADLAWWTMWFFGGYAFVRLAVARWTNVERNRAGHSLLLLLALIGGYLLYETGTHGASLVFEHGVGVSQRASEPEPVPMGLDVTEEGWRWRPESSRAWTEAVVWLQGAPTDVVTRLDTTGRGPGALALTTRAPVLFVVPDTLGNVQIAAEINADAFDGTVSLVYNARGAETYDFFGVSEGTVRQGRMSEGRVRVLDEAPMNRAQWQRVRAVSDGTHFRGYLGDDLQTHSHATAAEPGMAGIRLEGTGTVFVRRVEATGL